MFMTKGHGSHQQALSSRCCRALWCACTRACGTLWCGMNSCALGAFFGGG